MIWLTALGWLGSSATLSGSPSQSLSSARVSLKRLRWQWQMSILDWHTWGRMVLTHGVTGKTKLPSFFPVTPWCQNHPPPCVSQKKTERKRGQESRLQSCPGRPRPPAASLQKPPPPHEKRAEPPASQLCQNFSNWTSVQLCNTTRWLPMNDECSEMPT